MNSLRMKKMKKKKKQLTASGEHCHPDIHPPLLSSHPVLARNALSPLHVLVECGKLEDALGDTDFG
jgi:hypothetical protein